jgi:hypothetical protein
VSLQGSLDTFALPDVLLLLASTQKSGELHVAGSRTVALARHPDTEGRLWFDTGGMVGHDVGRAVEPADAVFELLRLNQGTFSFLSGTPSGGGPRVEVDGILVEAQARLAEWREIEAVVPSLDAWLQLAPEPPLAHVSMRAEQWRLVVAIASGCPVGAVLGHLGLDELPGCRAVKELVEAGLVLLSAQPAPAALPAFWTEPEAVAAPEPAEADVDIVYHRATEPDEEPAYAAFSPEEQPWAPAEDPAPSPWAAVEEPAASPWAPPAATDDAPAPFDPVPAYEPAHAYEPAPAYDPAPAFDPAPAYEPTPAFEPPAAFDPAPAFDPAAARVPAGTPGGDWRSELGDLPDLDAIANMTPKRRRAEGEEPTAVTATVAEDGEEGEEPLNRGLLLKFLSSVRN